MIYKIIEGLQRFANNDVTRVGPSCIAALQLAYVTHTQVLCVMSVTLGQRGFCYCSQLCCSICKLYLVLSHHLLISGQTRQSHRPMAISHARGPLIGRSHLRLVITCPCLGQNSTEQRNCSMIYETYRNTLIQFLLICISNGSFIMHQ